MSKKYKGQEEGLEVADSKIITIDEDVVKVDTVNQQLNFSEADKAKEDNGPEEGLDAGDFNVNNVDKDETKVKD